MNQEFVIEEAMKFVAAKIAADLKASGIDLTKDEVASAVDANWNVIANNIAELVASAEAIGGAK